MDLYQFLMDEVCSFVLQPKSYDVSKTNFKFHAQLQTFTPWNCLTPDESSELRLGESVGSLRSRGFLRRLPAQKSISSNSKATAGGRSGVWRKNETCSYLQTCIPLPCTCNESYQYIAKLPWQLMKTCVTQWQCSNCNLHCRLSAYLAWIRAIMHKSWLQGQAK